MGTFYTGGFLAPNTGKGQMKGNRGNFHLLGGPGLLVPPQISGAKKMDGPNLTNGTERLCFAIEGQGFAQGRGLRRAGTGERAAGFLSAGIKPAARTTLPLPRKAR
jgi:hypothetical protein